MIRKILGLCAREQGHSVVYGSLRQALSEYSKESDHWPRLVAEAERQGVAPLLYKHIRAIDFILPEEARRVLQALYLRSMRSSGTRTAAIIEILAALLAENIDVLLVKGIALSYFAYGSPGYRPMRDIDLLVKKEDLSRAEATLLSLDYRPDRNHDIPPDYYHLAPLKKTIEGLPVSVELHHNLLPLNMHYPPWPFEKSSDSAHVFTIDRIRARTLSLEDNLWYVYLHGFRAPLTYEAFRFIHVADIVNLVEHYYDRLDWDRLHREHPSLFTVLGCIHHVTPWPEEIVDRLELDVRNRPAHTGLPYDGWPKRHLKPLRNQDLLRLTQATFWPPQWWLQVYYGRRGRLGGLKARFIEHPRTLWRWIKAYYRRYISDTEK